MDIEQPHDHDFALIGLAGDDVYFAGPFDHAVAALQMLSRDLLAEYEDAAGVIQINADIERAMLMIAARMDGEFQTTAYLLIPVPAREGEYDRYQMTDLGLWENELAEIEEGHA